MNLTRLVIAERPVASNPRLSAGWGGGIDGNSRLTGGAGAALAVEAVRLP